MMSDHDHPDTDLTDPHGEAEALRRENARLKVKLDRREKLLDSVILERTHYRKRAEAAEAKFAAILRHLGGVPFMRSMVVAEHNANGAYILYADGSALIKVNPGAKASPVMIPVPVAASRAPDPVANARSCKPGDTIRQLLERPEAEMRAKGRNPLDYTSKWKQAADVVASLPAAPVAEAKPIEDKILARAEEIEKEARNG